MRAAVMKQCDSLVDREVRNSNIPQPSSPIQNQKPETRNQKPETLTPKPQTPNPKP